MRSKIARLLKVKRDKDISDEIIISTFNMTKNEKIKIELLKILIDENYFIIGSFSGKENEYMLEDIKPDNSYYKYLYKELKTEFDPTIPYAPIKNTLVASYISGGSELLEYKKYESDIFDKLVKVLKK